MSTTSVFYLSASFLAHVVTPKKLRKESSGVVVYAPPSLYSRTCGANVIQLTPQTYSDEDSDSTSA